MKEEQSVQAQAARRLLIITAWVVILAVLIPTLLAIAPSRATMVNTAAEESGDYF